MKRFLIILFSLPATLWAQHPIEVQQKAAAGDYMAALITFEKMPKKRADSNVRISAARSAWALGLSDRAIQEYEQALQTGQLSDQEKARVYLGKAIIYHQEGNSELTAREVERAYNLLSDPSPLRANILALWGESLAAQKAYALAEAKYSQALTEIQPDLVPEVAFLLGSVQKEVGKDDEARQNFEKIPLGNDRAPQGMRSLAEIEMRSGHSAKASFWIEKARSEYPDQFLDGWSDYVLARGAIEQRDTAALIKIRDDAEKRLPPSDGWLVALIAATEEHLWQESTNE